MNGKILRIQNVQKDVPFSTPKGTQTVCLAYTSIGSGRLNETIAVVLPGEILAQFKTTEQMTGRRIHTDLLSAMNVKDETHPAKPGVYRMLGRCRVLDR